MYNFVVALVQPYTLVYLLLALGIGNLWRKRKENRGRLLLVTIPFVLLALLSMPAVAGLGYASLERHYPPQQTRPEDAEAIVVLSSYVKAAPIPGGRPEMDSDTMYRCLHAADLYRHGRPVLVLVSGGQTGPTSWELTAAPVMRDFLVQLGVPARDVLVESTSRTTHENAVESCQLLKARGIRKIVLVTNAVDLYRAVRCFRKQGMDVVPSGCNYHPYYPDGGSLHDFWPTPGSIKICHRVWHEWLGTAWYWLRGRI